MTPLELFRRLTNGLYVVGVAHREQRDAFTAALLVLTVLALLIWQRLPVLALVAGGGVVGILARSRLVHRLRELA